MFRRVLTMLALVLSFGVASAQAQFFPDRFEALTRRVNVEMGGGSDGVALQYQTSLFHFAEGAVAYALAEQFLGHGLEVSFAYQVGTSLESLSYQTITWRKVRGELYDIHQGMCPALVERAGRTSLKLAIVTAVGACLGPMFLYVTDEVPPVAIVTIGLPSVQPVTLFSVKF